MVLVESEKILYNTHRTLSITREKTGRKTPAAEENMEEKAKRVGKFNIVDIIAVILIVAVVAFVGWKLLSAAAWKPGRPL